MAKKFCCLTIVLDFINFYTAFKLMALAAYIFVILIIGYSHLNILPLWAFLLLISGSSLGMLWYLTHNSPDDTYKPLDSNCRLFKTELSDIIKMLRP